MVKDIYQIKECPDCGGSEIIYKKSNDQVICRDCGLIYEPTVDMEKKKLR